MASKRKFRKLKRAYEKEFLRLQAFHGVVGAPEPYLSRFSYQGIHRQSLEKAQIEVGLMNVDTFELRLATESWMRDIIIRSFGNGPRWWADNFGIPKELGIPTTQSATTAELEEAREKLEKAREILRAKDNRENTASPNTENDNIITSLQELADLKEKGLIDDEEFKSAKRKLLE